MILTPHILIGAAIGSRLASPFLAFVFGFLSHYLAEAFPHYEYQVPDLKNQKSKFNNKSSFLQFSKIAVDFLFGLSLALWLVWHLPFKSSAIVGMLAATVPDGLLFLAWRFPNQPVLKFFRIFHRSSHLAKNHLPQKKFSPIWLGLTVQVIISALAVIFLIM